MAMVGTSPQRAAEMWSDGIVRASPALFGSSRERPAVGFMAGFLQARGLLKVERELLRLSGKDGRNTRHHVGVDRFRSLFGSLRVAGSTVIRNLIGAAADNSPHRETTAL